MDIKVRNSRLAGTVRIPASKSHTIRALFIATLADGRSEIIDPLDSADTEGAVRVCKGLGARIGPGSEGRWVVEGTGGAIEPPAGPIDVANSGTSLRIAMGVGALLDKGELVLTGDAQVRARPAQPLIDSLNELGARVESIEGNGRAPLRIRGRLEGGTTSIACPTSQYLTSLLIACPLADGTTEIHVTELNERPYVEMTIDWLDRAGIEYERDGFDRFSLPGGQGYSPFERAIPSDFSSATFFLCAAAVTGSELVLDGLDMSDSQGDKAVVDMLEMMGAEIERGRSHVSIRGGPLHAADLDLNATPDALPAMAVAACCAEGTSRLYNAPQARLKETDRIAVMRSELAKMGAEVEELPDGLVIEGRPLRGTRVDGWDDHRVVMALACAGLAARGETTVSGAESVAVTFPTFVELMQQCGANMEQV